MVGHELHVLMLGMVFEIGVEPIAPRRADHVKEPGQLVVAERDGLRDPKVLQPGFALSGSGDKLFEDEQVPLLVVLLNPGFYDPFVDTSGEVGVSMDVGDGNVGDLFPALIGHPGDEFEHLEFRQGALASVEQAHHP
jgi:hypothetical protein